MMLWSNEHWKTLRDKAYQIARALGAGHHEADDSAQTAILALKKRRDRALAGEQEPLRNPEGYLYRAIERMVKKPENGRRQWEVIKDPTTLQEMQGHGARAADDVPQWMIDAAAVLQVVHFGQLQELGRVVLLPASSRIDPSSVEMARAYIARLLDTAPVARKTRKKAKEKFARLWARALQRVRVDMTGVIDEEDYEEPGKVDWLDMNGARRELSGNASDGVALLRLLFPRMHMLKAVEHAVAVVDEVWAGRDRGTSLWAFHIDREPDKVREVEHHLKELWRWPYSGELTVTAGEECDICIRVTVVEGVFMVDAPTGEQCFGRPLSSDAVEVLVEDLGYEPPDDEDDGYFVGYEFDKKDHVEDLVALIFDTLEVYGWDSSEDFDWACEYDGPDDEEDEDEAA